jgi:hypothetical protein
VKRASIRNRLAGLCVAAVAAVGVQNANAFLIDGTEDDFSVAWSALVGTNLLAAHATFDVTNVTANTITFDIQIFNDSVLTTFTNAGLASFGLQTAPAGTSASISGGAVFDGASIASIPSLNFINLCVWSGNNCAGGPQNDLLAVGANDSFTLTLSGVFPNGLEVLDSGIKFQTSGGSFEFPGTECPPGSTICEQPPPPQLPEPGTLLLLGLALLGLVPLRRSRT